MNFKNWYNYSTPEFKIKNGGNYSIEKPSIWKLDFIIKKNTTIKLEFNFSWNSLITIISHENGTVKRFQLKRQSIWKPNYLLTNDSNQQLCCITSQFSWKNWKTNYQIIENEIFPVIEDIEILYLSIIHCIVMKNNNATGA
ncbi:MAG: hypothetical protein HC854_04435 [Flavobacterium sp.]|nr:hypothetical protein [Flavobacterium sp.]